MKYLSLICFSIFTIGIGAIKAFDSVKRKKSSSDYTDKSFVMHLIMGIPTFLVSIYYFLATPSSDLLLVGTIIVSGITAFIIGLHYSHIKKQWEKNNSNKD